MIRNDVSPKNLALFAAFLFFIAGTFISLDTLEMRDGNDGWSYVFKVVLVIELLALPLLLFTFRKTVRKWLRVYGGLAIFAMLGLFFLMLVFGAPYVFLANALTANGQVVSFKGSITSKWIQSGRGKTHMIKISDEISKQSISFALRPDEYNQVQVGKIFERCMYAGGLGIPFRWRYADAQPSCSR